MGWGGEQGQGKPLGGFLFKEQWETRKGGRWGWWRHFPSQVGTQGMRYTERDFWRLLIVWSGSLEGGAGRQAGRAMLDMQRWRCPSNTHGAVGEVVGAALKFWARPRLGHRSLA